MIKPNLQCGFHHNVHILRIYISNPSVVLVWPLGNNFKRNFVQYDREGTEKMGGHVRLYKMPDGLLLGFYREQGGYIKFAKIPGTDKVVYAYMNPEDDDRFELVTQFARQHPARHADAEQEPAQHRVDADIVHGKGGEHEQHEH
ncbi:hypothetical protein LCGC14_2558410, partial [marine sediment metagenome]